MNVIMDAPMKTASRVSFAVSEQASSVQSFILERSASSFRFSRTDSHTSSKNNKNNDNHVHDINNLRPGSLYTSSYRNSIYRNINQEEQDEEEHDATLNGRSPSFARRLMMHQQQHNQQQQSSSSLLSLAVSLSTASSSLASIYSHRPKLRRSVMIPFPQPPRQLQDIISMDDLLSSTASRVREALHSLCSHCRGSGRSNPTHAAANCDAMHRACAHDFIVLAMVQHASDTVVQCMGLGLLQNMAHYLPPACRPELGQDGGLDYIVMLLEMQCRRFADSDDHEILCCEKVLVRACGALATLTTDCAENVTTLVDGLNGLPILAMIMVKCVMSCTIQQHVAHILYNVCKASWQYRHRLIFLWHFISDDGDAFNEGEHNTDVQRATVLFACLENFHILDVLGDRLFLYSSNPILRKKARRVEEYIKEYTEAWISKVLREDLTLRTASLASASSKRSSRRRRRRSRQQSHHEGFRIAEVINLVGRQCRSFKTSEIFLLQDGVTQLLHLMRRCTSSKQERDTQKARRSNATPSGATPSAAASALPPFHNMHTIFTATMSMMGTSSSSQVNADTTRDPQPHAQSQLRRTLSPQLSLAGITSLLSRASSGKTPTLQPSSSSTSTSTSTSSSSSSSSSASVTPVDAPLPPAALEVAIAGTFALYKISNHREFQSKSSNDIKNRIGGDVIRTLLLMIERFPDQYEIHMNAWFTIANLICECKRNAHVLVHRLNAIPLLMKGIVKYTARVRANYHDKKNLMMRTIIGQEPSPIPLDENEVAAKMNESHGCNARASSFTDSKMAGHSPSPSQLTKENVKRDASSPSRSPSGGGGGSSISSMTRSHSSGNHGSRKASPGSELSSFSSMIMASPLQIQSIGFWILKHVCQWDEFQTTIQKTEGVMMTLSTFLKMETKANQLHRDAHYAVAFDGCRKLMEQLGYLVLME